MHKDFQGNIEPWRLRERCERMFAMSPLLQPPSNERTNRKTSEHVPPQVTLLQLMVTKHLKMDTLQHTKLHTCQGPPEASGSIWTHINTYFNSYKSSRVKSLLALVKTCMVKDYNCYLTRMMFWNLPLTSLQVQQRTKLRQVRQDMG